MKKSLLSVSALLGIVLTTNQTFSQATISWKQQFAGSPLSTFDEAGAFTTTILDTTGKNMYYLSELYQGETTDFDPSTKKANLTGAINAIKFPTLDDAEDFAYGHLTGIPTLSAYDLNTGAYKWAKKMELLTNDSYVAVSDILTLNNKSGLYVVCRFAGKLKFNSVVYTSSQSTNLYADILVLRLSANGTTLKSAIIKASANSKPYLNIQDATTDMNGSLLLAVENHGVNGKIDANPSTAIKDVALNTSDIAIIKLDSDLKYLNHGKIDANGNNVYISNMIIDASKNIVISANVYGTEAGGANGVDFDLASTQKLFGQNTLSSETADLVIVKYNPLMQYSWMKKINQVNGRATIMSDKMGNIHTVSTLLGDLETIQFGGGDTYNGQDNKTTIVFGKFDKNGNFLASFSDVKVGYNEFGISTFMDKNSNIYYATTITGANSNSNIYTSDIYMAKLKTTGNYSLLWKNRITAVTGNASAAAITAYNNEVVVTGVATKGTYKMLVSSPTNKMVVNTLDYGVSFFVKYKLSGVALAPEEQAEENNFNNSFKTSMEENSLSLAVYPNPAKDELTVKTTLSEEETAVLTIYNYSGVVVKTVTLNSAETKLAISELVSGIYFVELVSNEGKEVQKLIKE
ncbi:MAG: T9SS type A sorting domain-containing protein [Bacteroidetes bacterium]|nr:T9SS type A sorting domain-containing protein [Bacteroidota bacterium]